MQPRFLALVFGALATLLLAACGSPSTSNASPTAARSVQDTPTPPPGTFYFTTEDGVTLNGQFYGQGTTAVIFSNGKGVTQSEWRPFAERLARSGYLTMTYDYRGLGQSQGNDNPNLRERDLRAAVRAAQARGATKIVLMGSSFGGLLAARIAGELKPAAVAMLSAPMEDGALKVTDTDLRALAMPKLFMASEQDSLSIAPMRHMYDVASQPKQLVVYPGKWHGTAILITVDNGEDATQRLIAFVEASAPA